VSCAVWCRFLAESRAAEISSLAFATPPTTRPTDNDQQEANGNGTTFRMHLHTLRGSIIQDRMGRRHAV
jgi:hypothetical protein